VLSRTFFTCYLPLYVHEKNVSHIYSTNWLEKVENKISENSTAQGYQPDSAFDIYIKASVANFFKFWASNFDLVNFSPFSFRSSFKRSFFQRNEADHPWWANANIFAFLRRMAWDGFVILSSSKFSLEVSVYRKIISFLFLHFAGLIVFHFLDAN
jgi:hypothetical protein